MRVAYISTFPPTKCGIAEYTYDLVNAMRNIRGHVDITVYRLSNGDVVKNGEYDFAGFNIVDVDTLAGSSTLDLSKILDVVEGHYDVIHVQHEYSVFPSNTRFLAFLRALKRHGDRLVLTMHTVKHHSCGYADFQRAVSEIADLIVVHSYLQEAELTFQGVDPGKVVQIPHGTRPIEAPDPNSGQMTFLVQGFIRADKGLDVLFKAFGRLMSEGVDARLLVAGQPQNTYNFNSGKALEALGVPPRGVHFINGFLTRREIGALYASAHAVILPYVDNGCDIGVSGALHVAMGARRPPICSRVPRLVECVERAPQLTFRAGDPMSLYRRLRMAVEDYEYVLESVQELFRYAELTGWDAVAGLHLAAYNGDDPHQPGFGQLQHVGGFTASAALRAP